MTAEELVEKVAQEISKADFDAPYEEPTFRAHARAAIRVVLEEVHEIIEQQRYETRVALSMPPQSYAVAYISADLHALTPKEGK